MIRTILAGGGYQIPAAHCSSLKPIMQCFITNRRGAHERVQHTSTHHPVHLERPSPVQRSVTSYRRLRCNRVWVQLPKLLRAYMCFMTIPHSAARKRPKKSPKWRPLTTMLCRPVRMCLDNLDLDCPDFFFNPDTFRTPQPVLFDLHYSQCSQCLHNRWSFYSRNVVYVTRKIIYIYDQN